MSNMIPNLILFFVLQVGIDKGWGCVSSNVSLCQSNFLWCFSWYPVGSIEATKICCSGKRRNFRLWIRNNEESLGDFGQDSVGLEPILHPRNWASVLLLLPKSQRAFSRWFSFWRFTHFVNSACGSVLSKQRNRDDTWWSTNKVIFFLEFVEWNQSAGCARFWVQVSMSALRFSPPFSLSLYIDICIITCTTELHLREGIE